MALVKPMAQTYRTSAQNLREIKAHAKNWLVLALNRCWYNGEPLSEAEARMLTTCAVVILGPGALGRAAMEEAAAAPVSAIGERR